MSVLPEAKLAHEAEIRYSVSQSSTLLLRLLIENFFDDDSYALIATVTGYSSWRPNAEDKRLRGQSRGSCQSRGQAMPNGFEKPWPEAGPSQSRALLTGFGSA